MKQFGLGVAVGLLFDIAIAWAVTGLLLKGDLETFIFLLGFLWLTPVLIGALRAIKAWVVSLALGAKARAAFAKQIHESGAVKFSPFSADLADFVAEVLHNPHSTQKAREFAKEVAGFVDGFSQVAPFRAILLRHQLSAALRQVQERTQLEQGDA